MVVTCTGYVQSLDQDNLWIVLCKAQVWALCSQSVHCPSALWCNVRCDHVLADWMTMVHRGTFNVGQENLLPFTKVMRKVPGKSQAKEMEVHFVRSHCSDKCALYMYYNTLLLMKVNVIPLSFSWFSLGELAFIHALHTALDAIWGLGSWAIRGLVVSRRFAP